jgi:hypothetical protein
MAQEMGLRKKNRPGSGGSAFLQAGKLKGWQGVEAKNDSKLLPKVASLLLLYLHL